MFVLPQVKRPRLHSPDSVADVSIPPEDFEKRNSNISTAQTSFTDCTYPLLISGRSKSQGHIEEWLFIIQASTRPFGLFCL